MVDRFSMLTLRDSGEIASEYSSSPLTVAVRNWQLGKPQMKQLGSLRRNHRLVIWSNELWILFNTDFGSTHVSPVPLPMCVFIPNLRMWTTVARFGIFPNLHEVEMKGKDVRIQWVLLLCFLTLILCTCWDVSPCCWQQVIRKPFGAWVVSPILIVVS